MPLVGIGTIKSPGIQAPLVFGSGSCMSGFFCLSGVEMCLADVITKLRSEGIFATAAKIHYAIQNGRVSRPQLDGSLTFDFTESDIAELRVHFLKKRSKSARA